mgnify:CR=1 FL=1
MTVNTGRLTTVVTTMNWTRRSATISQEGAMDDLKCITLFEFRNDLASGDDTFIKRRTSKTITRRQTWIVDE